MSWCPDFELRDTGTTVVYNKGQVVAEQRHNLHGDEKLYFIASGAAIKVQRAPPSLQLVHLRSTTGW